MFDVAAAIRWSLRVLKPDGLLVVNDYVGPTRVQWRRAQIDYARRFLASIGVDPSSLRYRTPYTRLRQIIGDPSEAPQSDRIESAYHDATGATLHPLGGVILQLCTRFLPDDGDHPRRHAGVGPRGAGRRALLFRLRTLAEARSRRRTDTNMGGYADERTRH